MGQIQENKKWKKIMYSKWTLGALFLLFLIMAQATWHVYIRQTVSSQDREKAEKAVAIALTNNTNLKQQIAQLQTEKGIEEEIRKKYSVSKPGEEVAVIVDPKSQDTPNISFVKKTWWQQVLDFFKF